MLDRLIFPDMFGSRKSLTLILIVAFCTNVIEVGAFRTVRSSVRTGAKDLSCSIHGGQCVCPEMCSHPKPLLSKASCHSVQRAKDASPPAGRSSCEMKSKCNEKGSPIDISGSALRDFLPVSNAMDSVIFPISVVMLSLRLSPLNRNLPSPFHPPRSC